MQVALSRYDEIATTVIGEFAGFLVKNRGEGDGVPAAFPRAADAEADGYGLERALGLRRDAILARQPSWFFGTCRRTS